MKLYQRLAQILGAIRNLERIRESKGFTDLQMRWLEQRSDTLQNLVKEHMPSGSGFDQGTTLDEDSTPEKLIFHTSFHHMDEYGYYGKWTEHKVVVTPSLAFELNLRITGQNLDDIKEYISDVFSAVLSKEV